MSTTQIYVLDPASGELVTPHIPVENANPRLVEVDAEGRWLALFGAALRVARYDPTADPEIIWALDPPYVGGLRAIGGSPRLFANHLCRLRPTATSRPLRASSLLPSR
jgi:hypothetical protein